MTLSNEVECDEAYVVAGHKGQPDVVKSKGRKGRRRRRKSKSGRGTMAKEKPPVFDMIQRSACHVIEVSQDGFWDGELARAVLKSRLNFVFPDNLFDQQKTGKGLFLPSCTQGENDG